MVWNRTPWISDLFLRHSYMPYILLWFFFSWYTKRFHWSRKSRYFKFHFQYGFSQIEQISSKSFKGKQSSTFNGFQCNFYEMIPTMSISFSFSLPNGNIRDPSHDKNLPIIFFCYLWIKKKYFRINVNLTLIIFAELHYKHVQS